MSSGVQLPPLPFHLSPEAYCKIHRLAHPQVFVRKSMVLILSPDWWLEGLFCSPTPGLVPVSSEPCSQLGTGVRRQCLTGHSDCGPSLPPHSDLTSFWCSYATERLERGERLSLEPILALWENVEGQDVVSANVYVVEAGTKYK